jgi:hypothetical protein
MDIQVKLIKVGELPIPQTVKDATFTGLRDLIGAKWAENVWVDGTENTMLVDEEGLLHEKQYNPAAAAVADKIIVGDALIVRLEDLDAIPYE